MLPNVPFLACLARWAGDELMEGYYSAAAGHRTTATKQTRFGSFPPYLFISLKRWVLPGWLAASMASLDPHLRIYCPKRD